MLLFLTDRKGFMTINITKAVRKRIRARKPGWVFTPREFVRLGTRAAIDQALSRLQRRGEIRRLARGVYELPRIHPRIGTLAPSPESVAQAVAARTHSHILVSGAKALNLLGLSPQVPVQNLYLTEGPSRTVKIGNQTVTLKHVAPSKMLGAGTEAGIVLQAVRSYGQKRVHEIPVRALAEKLPRTVKSAVQRLTAAAPAWAHPALQQITA
jgi:predicted transcriptional regulator of viral defense system